jgi:hypothetical protein
LLALKQEEEGLMAEALKMEQQARSTSKADLDAAEQDVFL